MNLSLSKKNQISIFIIVMMIIFVLLFYLVNINTQDTKRQISESREELTTGNFQTQSLQNELSTCLSLQLERAVIIAGSKGGLIYDKSDPYERYANAQIESYDSNFTQIYGLNPQILQKTLLHHTFSSISPRKDDVTIAFINTTDYVLVYNRSVKDDFEEFIEEEFLRCIDLTKYRDLGFNIYQREFSGSIVDFNSTHAKSERIIGEVDDKVRIVFESASGLEVQSKIERFEDQYTILKLNEPDSLSQIQENQIDSLIGINNNSNLRVSVNFQDEVVQATLYFPIIFRNSNTEFSSTMVQAEVSNRFDILLRLSTAFTMLKYQQKQLDLTNKTTFNNEFINKSNFRSYFANTRYNNISFKQSIIEDLPEYKLFEFTFTDNDFRLSNRPYKFSFAYENHAPFLNLSKLGFINEDSQRYYLIAPTDSEITYNLSEVVSERQFFDMLKYYFINKTQISTNTQFSINSEGIVEFKTSQPSRYSYEVQVTDGEAVRTYELIFLAGLPDNTNNQASTQCYSITHNDNDLFPVDGKYKNQIFDLTGENKPYSFVIDYEDTFEDANPSFSLRLNPSCIFTQGGVDFTVKANGDELSFNESTGLINLSNTDFTQAINISTHVTFNGQNLIEPIWMMLYPTSCLGPGEMFESTQGWISGPGTCCDLSEVDVYLPSSVPSNFPIDKINNLRSSGFPALNEDVYLTLNLDSNIFPQTSINSTLVNIWSDPRFSGLNPTGLYEGKLRATCSGELPRWQENLDGILDGSDYTSEISEYVSLNNNFTLPSATQFNIDLVDSTQVCEFTQLTDILSFYPLTTDGLVFEVGFKVLHDGTIDPADDYYKGPIPIGTTPEPLILCDDNWYGSSNPNPIIDWQTQEFPYRVNQTSYRSKAYCSIGVIDCNKFDYSVPPEDNKLNSISGGACKWTFFNGNELSSDLYDSSTSCGNPITISSQCFNSTDSQIGNFVSRERFCDGSSSSCPLATRGSCTISCPSGMNLNSSYNLADLNQYCDNI